MLLTKKIFTMSLLAAAIMAGGLYTASTSMAADTTISGSVSVGESDTMAYSINAQQSYEPWLSGEAGELRPTAEISAFALVGDDDTVWGAALAPGLRMTMFTSTTFQPFLAGSVGGAVVSDRDIESRDVGSNVLFRSKGIVGVEFGEEMRHRIQGEYTNYSTWGITATDDGYNTVGVSYGYSF